MLIKIIACSITEFILWIFCVHNIFYFCSKHHKHLTQYLQKNINTSKLNICPGIMDILCLAFAVVFVIFHMLIAKAFVVDVWRPMAIWRQLEASKQNSVKALRKWCWRIRAKNAAHRRIRFSSLILYFGFFGGSDFPHSYSTWFSKFPRWSLKCWMLIWNAAIKIKWFLIKWNADFIAFSDNLL